MLFRSAQGTAKLLRDSVFHLHGTSNKIIHDCGPQFQSNFTVNFYRSLGIENNPSTAYHPQTDGKTERINQEPEQYLRLYVNHHQNDWVDWLLLAEFTYNNRRHASTRFSPFFVNQGYHPSPYAASQSVLMCGMTNNAVVDFVKDMKRIHEEVRANLEWTNLRMRHNYDRHKKPAIGYKPGDMVWLSASNIPSDRPSKKLDHRYLGPYEVVEKVGRLAYKLKTPGRSTRHATLNESLLKPHILGVFPGQIREPPPPPEIRDGSEEWEVESIKDSRYYRNQLQYLVHWQGYDVSEDSWEPATHLKHAREIVQEYHLTHPTRPRPKGHIKS